MTVKELIDLIETEIGKIPASNPAYISAHRETLSSILSADLLRKIAAVTAKTAMDNIK